MEQQPVSLTPSPFRRFSRSPLLYALASALLMWLSFFPMNWGWLGWAALVPLLKLTVIEYRRSVYAAAWLHGFAFGLPALQWIRLAHPAMNATWIGLALLFSVHSLLFVWLTRQLTLKARLPLMLVAPCAWIGLEYLRAHLGIGFAWYFIGHTQHDYLAVIQIADVFGAYGVGFLVVLVNVALFHLLTISPKRQRGLLISTAAIAGLLVFTLCYGFWRLQWNEFATGPKVALLQPNLPQEIKDDPNQDREITAHMVRLANEAAKQNPDVIVFPETSLPPWWLQVSPELGLANASPVWQGHHQESEELFGDTARQWRTACLFGLNAGILDTNHMRKYNSAILIGSDGKEIDRYDKMYRVPFGEYLPWKDAIPWMVLLSPYPFDYSLTAGDRLTIFELPGPSKFRFAVLICYEDAVPHLAPEFMRTGSPDFFVNISNDGWFKGSSEHEQHLVLARFRAIENRRAVARAVNMGVSAVIDGNGRIVALPGKTWQESKDRTAVVVSTIPIDSRQSAYVKWGDVLPGLCLVVCGVGLVLAIFRKL